MTPPAGQSIEDRVLLDHATTRTGRFQVRACLSAVNFDREKWHESAHKPSGGLECTTAMTGAVLRNPNLDARGAVSVPSHSDQAEPDAVAPRAAL